MSSLTQYGLLRRVAQRLLTLTPFVLTPLFAQGATYYVAKTGSDSNSCTAAAPCLTIRKGISVMSGGDTLVIGDGTYEEFIHGGPPSGSAGAPTTIRAANRNKAVLLPNAPSDYYVVQIADRNWVVIDGLVADACTIQSYPFRLEGSTANTVIKNVVAKNGHGDYSTGIAFHSTGGGNQLLNSESHHNGFSTCGGSTPASAAGHGGYFAGHDALIEGNRFYNNAWISFQIYNYSGGANNNTARNNIAHDNGSGVIVSGDGNLVYNNLIYNNTARAENGIWVYGAASNAEIFNNTIYGNNAYCITVDSGASSNQIKNNICYQNRYGAINDGGAGTTCTYNLGVSGGEGGSNNCSSSSSATNPAFVDLSAVNFHLQGVSPAIQTGVNLSSTFTTDFDGNPRPTSSVWDKGAFTYTVGPSAPSPPTNLRVTGTN